MSGHSKWSTIKRKKGALDARKNKIFTKLIREISVAAKMGGGDIDSNARLRLAVNKARVSNMPKDNIEKAIKKGIGDNTGSEYFELTYEAYAPHGVALIINCLTDNKNRTASDIRSVLAKGGGSLGSPGSVSYMFHKKGLILYSLDRYSEDIIMELALEAGAEDVCSEGSQVEVITSVESFESILSLLKTKFEEDIAEIALVPENKISLNKEQMDKILALIEKLEDFDDIQEIVHNLEIID
ncbi:YebC/PmpR family DNA-binding transcriptional regulator [Borrelia miyamotoi]|uniref:Probable transcriptional regulatory protein O5404_04175 n=1 Tax=Borrelia miyamotoi TaxID=47466 RepID=A0AAX3JN08_9SPIR|nr:YebC/PmpR family DNA-binding transcriptional regulator [Borrelia miyamotoi]QFP42263.1 YebC/PmpR family DNA-binding transcriptional regulator [Borrelia miyamotoi]QFP48377.1 YebC/PmpR family DNA-binding transcriptional regulator [Borrelia miyamotoi]QGT56137.1 YebC/PmpR family DNA-binding transcriptional regulator [Borrelia miyamotoi]QGT56917.1 YebC/PmpR family DNA-binding transcriptional regulator [Borrelia miyamotoi]WAZ72182.1 YebC/PmpR family DNA-binding transcriptional regulator [Borrelia 